MIYNSPFFSFPYYRKFNKKNKYNYYTNYYLNNDYFSNKMYPQNYNLNNFYNNIYNQNSQKNINPKTKNNLNCTLNETVEEKSIESKEIYEDKLFEVFGLKLFFDDILLICLIFFLYNEGVKDYYLFISLILLLLS